MYNFYSVKKLVLGAIFVFFLTSCSTEPVRITHGVLNLEGKYKSISNNISNKNDIINIFGETLLKEYPDDSIWIYVESEQTNSLFGKKKIIKNNILVLEFNKIGILMSKNIIDAKKLQDVDFEKITTKGYSVNETFSKKLFASIRKRFQNKSNSQNSQ